MIIAAIVVYNRSITVLILNRKCKVIVRLIDEIHPRIL